MTVRQCGDVVVMCLCGDMRGGQEDAQCSPYNNKVFLETRYICNGWVYVICYRPRQLMLNTSPS